MPDDLHGPPRPTPQGPLDPAATIRAGSVQVTVGPALDRLCLRGLPHAFAAALPRAVGAAHEEADAALLCLGPDEWLALAPAGSPTFAALRGVEGPDGVAVDVSARQVALTLAGRDAAELLNAGCPLDLHPSAFPVGSCTRTLLGKAEIVLWRRAPDGFHLEVARSFAAYAWALLANAAPPVAG